MAYRMVRVPRQGERIRHLAPPIPGGQHALIHSVQFYIPDFNRWAVVMAWEHNASGRGVEVEPTGDPIFPWREVEPV